MIIYGVMYSGVEDIYGMAISCDLRVTFMQKATKHCMTGGK
jgi:hypothetical protein